MMEYYSAIKKKEILSYAKTWMNLEGIALCEINQTEKNKYYIISLAQKIKNKQTNKLIDTEKKNDGCQRQGMGSGPNG